MPRQLHASQKADMTLGDLASAITSTDPVLAEMGVDAVKNAMQQMDTRGFTVTVDRGTRAAMFSVFRSSNSYRAKIT